MEDTLIYFGSKAEIKSINEDTAEISGHLVLWGSPQEADGVGDYFTPETYFGVGVGGAMVKAIDLFYQHGIDVKLQKDPISTAQIGFDEVGIWMRAQLDLRNKYNKAIAKLVEKGALGLSSGALSHLVKRTKVEGKNRIDQWILGEGSLTPTPADWRNVVMSAKSLDIQNLELNSEGLDTEGDERGVEGQAEETETPLSATNIDTGETAMPPEATTEAQTPDFAGMIKAAVAEALKSTIVTPSAGAQDSKIDGAPAIKKVTGRGFSDDAVKSFLWWIKTGDERAVKAANQEDTDTEGGFLVPDDFRATIIQKRDELSLVRQIPGITHIQTDLKLVNIPMESSSTTALTLTAEEAAYTEVEPTFSEKAITVYKYTRTTIISNELEADEKGGLQTFLNSWIGRGIAKTENAFFISGTGSGQPQGILVGGTAALTLDAVAAIGAGEIPEFLGLMPDYYANGAVLVMKRATEFYLRGLTGSTWLFENTPAGNLQSRSLFGAPVYNTDAMPAVATGLKSLAYFNPEFYILVDRAGLTMVRDPYSAGNTGQVKLYTNYRLGGGVSQALAVNYATQAAA